MDSLQKHLTKEKYNTIYTYIDANIFECNICKLTLKYSGSEGNLNRHLNSLFHARKTLSSESFKLFQKQLTEKKKIKHADESKQDILKPPTKNIIPEIILQDPFPNPSQISLKDNEKNKFGEEGLINLRRCKSFEEFPLRKKVCLKIQSSSINQLNLSSSQSIPNTNQCDPLAFINTRMNDMQEQINLLTNEHLKLKELLDSGQNSSIQMKEKIIKKDMDKDRQSQSTFENLRKSLDQILDSFISNNITNLNKMEEKNRFSFDANDKNEHYENYQKDVNSLFLTQIEELKKFKSNINHIFSQNSADTHKNSVETNISDKLIPNFKEQSNSYTPESLNQDENDIIPPLKTQKNEINSCSSFSQMQNDFPYNVLLNQINEKYQKNLTFIKDSFENNDDDNLKITERLNLKDLKKLKPKQWLNDNVKFL